MKHTVIRLVAAMVLLVATGNGVSAGGWAVVHLDAMPTDVRAGVPVQIGFTVMQHDVSPVNVDQAFLSAIHKESGESLMEEARQDGAEGHYFVEATFPKAGGWKWSIIPAPFEGTSFETLNVLDETAEHAPWYIASGHPVHIHTGICSELGEVVFPLSNLVDDAATLDGTPVPAGEPTNLVGEPIAISSTTIPITVGELTANPHAINVHLRTEEIGTYIACGAIGGPMWDGALVVGLTQLNDSGQVGIALLSEIGGEPGATLVTIYLLGGVHSPAVSNAQPVQVEISTDMVFIPSRVEIAAGTTVVWKNNSPVSHTITGTDLAFSDSSPLATGEIFSQTFTTPGTYDYFCGPHPFMTGVVVVT